MPRFNLRFYGRTVSAPAERPVLSRKARTGNEPQRGDLFKNIIENLPHNDRDIIEISKKIKVAPGIIVARLQYENLVPKSFGNELKVGLTF